MDFFSRLMTRTVLTCWRCWFPNFGSSSKWSKSCATISFSTVSLTLIWSSSSCSWKMIIKSTQTSKLSSVVGSVGNWITVSAKIFRFKSIHLRTALWFLIARISRDPCNRYIPDSKFKIHKCSILLTTKPLGMLST